MTLNNPLGPEPNIVDLRSETRWGAIEELIHHLVVTRRIAAEHRDDIAMAVRKREEAMSTGIGFDYAVPHATTGLISDAVVQLGFSRKGLQFDSLDGKPVHIVALVLFPPGQMQKHIHLLANIAKLLHSDDSRDGLWDRFM